MPNRREFFRAVMAGVAATSAMSRGSAGQGRRAVQGPSARRQVMVGGRRVKVIDVHAHCVIPVQDVVKGTPLAKMGGGGGNNVLGPRAAANHG